MNHRFGSSSFVFNADNKIHLLESQLSASEERAPIATQKVRDLVETQEKSLQKMADLSEQQVVVERAFKAIEIELVSTKTELSVKNQWKTEKILMDIRFTYKISRVY